MGAEAFRVPSELLYIPAVYKTYTVNGKTPTVMAKGGGTTTDPNNNEEMNKRFLQKPSLSHSLTSQTN